MSQEIEYWIDDHTLLVGDVTKDDASFDHAFGTEKSWEYSVENFSIVTYINDIDYDITSSMDEKSLEAFKDDLIYYYKENFDD